MPVNKHKPAPTKPGQSTRTTGRRLGQVLVDLGYIDEMQLDEILSESKNTGKQWAKRLFPAVSSPKRS